MKQISLRHRGTILAVALACGIAGGYSTSSLARTPQTGPANSRLDGEPMIFLAPDLTRQGRPIRRSGAASRGGCPSEIDPEKLIALIPETSVGLTVQANPTIWLSLPFSPAEFHSLEFVLNHESGETVYETMLRADETRPGVVSFALPKTENSLEVDRVYNWFVTVHCQSPEQIDGQPIFAGGSILRVSPSDELNGDLTAATTERGKAVVLARHGIWYDALGAIARLHPEDSTQEDWRQLLAAIGLDELASQPLVDCCEPSEQAIGAE